MFVLSLILSLFTLASCAYLILTVCMVKGFVNERNAARKALAREERSDYPDISQIKPVHELQDKEVWDCLKSFADQDYRGKNQVILAAASEKVFDEAFSGCDCAYLGSNAEKSIGQADGSNLKISSCIRAMEKAEHDIVVFSDADMKVSPKLLTHLADCLEKEGTGLATCLYIVKRASACGSIFEGLSVSDFCASVLVARLVEGIHFALGAVMALNKSVLNGFGGLERIKNYLADDYQMGFLTSQSGLKVVLAPEVCEDVVGDISFSEYFSHQLRWMRTYRVSRPGGFFSFFITQGIFWSTAAMAVSGFKLWFCAAFVLWLVLRIASSAYIWCALAEEKSLLKYALLAPVKDVFYVVMWFSAFFGKSTVKWGSLEYSVNKDGTLEPLKQSA